jgi:protease IV
MRFFSTLAASFLGTLAGLALLFVFALFFVFALASTSEQAPSVRPGSILVANLAGAYPETVSGDPFAQMFGGESPVDLHDVLRAFRMAAADDRIEGVWLRMGNVTESWASLQAMRRGIEEITAAGKPIYASSDNFFMAEDELFLASAADSIVLDPQSLFEFNGFSLQLTFFKRLLDRAGVNPQAVRAGRFKSAVEPYLRESMSVDNETQLQALVDGIETSFVDAIASARDLDGPSVRRMTRVGDLMTAQDAHEAGLVDLLAYDDQVEALFGEDIRKVTLRQYARSSPSSAGIRNGKDGQIAVVFADGTIVAGGRSGLPGMNDDTIGSRTFAKAMREARENDSIDAVVLRINSPGGLAPAADAMLREIELTRSEKPLIVSMGGLAASGGYWIAAAADTIVAEPLTLTGSIGVFGLMLDVSELMSDRIGITFDGVQTGPSADMMSGVRALSDAERLRLERSTDQTYERFLQIVAQGRGMTVEEVHRLAQGRIWTGRDALDRGLVDVLGGLDTAIGLAAERAGLEEDSYRVRELPLPPSFFEMFTESLETRAVRVAESAFSSRAATLPGPVASLLSDLNALLNMTEGVQARLPYFVETR